MKRWPIRIRLTAGFAVVMVLVLAGAAITTLSSFRAAFDESIDHTQAARLHALTTAGPRGSTQPDPGSPVGSDTATQVLDSARGAVLASPAQLNRRPLLTPAEVATAARDGELRVLRQTVTGLTGPVRILAASTPDGREVAVVATSLAEVLLLDEPTSALDGPNAALIAELARDHVAAGGTVVLASHNLAIVRSIADWVLVLDEGRLLLAGRPGEVDYLEAGR